MNKPLIILASTLALAAAVVIARTLSPVAPEPEETFPMASATPRPENRGFGRTSELPPTRVAVSAETSRTTTSRESVRHSGRQFSAPPSPAPRDQATSVISPRYTLSAQPNAASLARWLEGQPALRPDERIRVLPGDAPAGSSAGNGASAATLVAGTPRQSATTNGAKLLLLDASLHDPAAWVEDEKPLSAEQEAVKARIASEFEAEVAAAAQRPDAETFDNAWWDARARANWDYQKFFGGEAANRKGMEAARAALPKN